MSGPDIFQVRSASSGLDSTCLLILRLLLEVASWLTAHPN